MVYPEKKMSKGMSSGGGRYKYDKGYGFGSSNKSPGDQLIQERGNNYNATQDKIASKDMSNLKGQKYDNKA